jgi:hypothetical protein
VAALPDLVQIHEKFKDEGVVFISLTGEPPTDLPNVQAIADAHPGLRWPIGYGADPTLAQLNWDHMLPTYIVYDKSGKVVLSSHWHHRLEDTLVRLLAE